MASKLWLSWLSITAVSGLRWMGPHETVSATATANWTPAPTIEAHDLLRRGLYPSNLCGAQGPKHLKVYCSTNSYCAWFTDIKVIGCCARGGSCDAVYTTCIDKRYNPAQDEEGLSVPGVYTCTNLCYLNSFPDNYYQYGCGSTSVGEVVSYTWPGDNPDVSIDFFYTGAAGLFKANTVASPTTTAITETYEAQDSPTKTLKPAATSTSVLTSPGGSAKPPGIPTSTTGSAPPPAKSDQGLTIAANDAAGSSRTSPTIESSANGPINPADTTPPGSKKGLSTGAIIAIGVVGGIVAIVVITGLGFCYVRRRTKRNSQQFLNGPTNNFAPSATRPDQPTMGTRANPTELYQGLPVKTDGAQYQPVVMGQNPQHETESGYTNPVIPSSYEPYRRASPHPTVSTATFAPDSPYQTSIAPTPNMSQNQYSQFHELPTNRASRIPELDSSEVRGYGNL